jgi:hypothetical protein
MQEEHTCEGDVRSAAKATMPIAGLEIFRARPRVMPRRSINLALRPAMSAWTHSASEIVPWAAPGSRRPV